MLLIHSSIHSFFYSFHKCLMTIYYVSSTVLGTRNTSAKTAKSLLLGSLHKFQDLGVYAEFPWCHLADVLLKVNVTTYVHIKQPQKQVWLVSGEGGGSLEYTARGWWAVSVSLDLGTGQSFNSGNIYWVPTMCQAPCEFPLGRWPR